jgi:hypothetical protein
VTDLSGSTRRAELRLPSYPWRLAHLAALWGYGVSQPVFSMLDGNPEFLVINDATRAETVAFAVVLAFVPPLCAVGLELLVAQVSSLAAGIVHVLALWLFGFTALLQVLMLFDPSSRWAIVVPAVAAYGGAIAYLRWRPVQTFLSISVALPVLGLITFVATAPLAVGGSDGERLDHRGQAPVVVVVLDELPVTSLMRADGSVDAVRYPGFGRLAREATWYSRTTAVHEYTTFAVPAIATGNVPTSDQLATLADHPHNLFTLLGESYELHVREPVTRLCPVTYCPERRAGRSSVTRVRGLLHDLAINYLHKSLPSAYHGDIAPLREGWGALLQYIEKGNAEFLRTFAPGNEPGALYFLHTMAPHAPWAMLPSGHRYGGDWFVSGLETVRQEGRYERWRRGRPLLVAHALQRHLLELGHLDHFVATLLRRLDDLGLYDEALVVVTADHGASFRAGEWRRRVTPATVADIAAVPLFVKYPGQKQGREDRRAAMTIDILPTIADVLGIDLPWRVDGRSLRARPVVRPVRVGSLSTAVVTRPDRIAADIMRIARRNASLFGEGRDSLYRIGPRRELLGRDVMLLARSMARGATVELARDRELADVRPASGYVPAHVTGQVSWPALRPTEDIAIVLNGRVAAVTRPFESSGRTLFSALLDERLFREGPNDIAVYAVRGVGRRVELILLGGADGGSAARSSTPSPPS